MSKVEVLRRLHKDFNLDKSDFFTSKQGFTIIVRSGIEKIQYKLGLKVEFEVISCEKDFCCIKAVGNAPDRIPIANTLTSKRKTRQAKSTCLKN